MSDDTFSSNDSIQSSTGEPTAKARKTAKPRPKKVAKIKPEETVELVSAPAPSVKSDDARSNEESFSRDASPSHEWPEPEPASAGNQSASSEANKRKRRRRKGKGQAANANQAQPSAEEFVPSQGEPPAISQPAVSPPQHPRPQPPQQQQPIPRHKLDSEHHAKLAWKIYLAEVSEEGVALIGDQDAKELARRCFRLAEVFIEEQARRR